MCPSQRVNNSAALSCRRGFNGASLVLEPTRTAHCLSAKSSTKTYATTVYPSRETSQNPNRWYDDPPCDVGLRSLSTMVHQRRTTNNRHECRGVRAHPRPTQPASSTAWCTSKKYLSTSGSNDVRLDGE